MSEGPPQAPEPAPEPIAPAPQERMETPDPDYELLLAAATKLQEAGVKGLTRRTKETAEFHDALEAWRRKKEFAILYVKTMDKAQAVVRNARLFLDAGYTSGASKKAATAVIEESLIAAQRDRNAPEIIEYLDQEAERVSPSESQFPPVDLDLSSIEAMPVKDALYEIQKILTQDILKRQRLKPLKERLIETREKIRAANGMPPTPPYRP